MTKTTKIIAVILSLTLLFPITPVFALALKDSPNPYRVLYNVKRGDTLSSIARAFNVDPELVAAMNNLDSQTMVRPGQGIYLPREPEMTCVLQEGDTLWDIAQKYRIDVNRLISYNQIARPERLQIGDTIRIPADNAEEEPIPVRVASSSGIEIASRSIGVLPLPVIGVITSPYGRRYNGFHHGTDIAADPGTPIRAVKAGEVSFAGWQDIYGQHLIIDHGNDVQTLYGHASKLLVSAGDRVKKGEIIALVGSTGRTTGPHLHFEIRISGKTVDPMRYLSKL